MACRTRMQTSEIQQKMASPSGPYSKSSKSSTCIESSQQSPSKRQRIMWHKRKGYRKVTNAVIVVMGIVCVSFFTVFSFLFPLTSSLDDTGISGTSEYGKNMEDVTDKLTDRTDQQKYKHTSAESTLSNIHMLSRRSAHSSADNDLIAHAPLAANHVNLRKLLSTNTSKPNITSSGGGGGSYPKEIFTLAQQKQGALILHALGILYMFLGLAIVCDEFFVPALHVISTMLNISEDVAGATFMAAGGSAPELFTSIMAMFISSEENSNVGFGTIVGSAVFNVLFVIGMCVVFSKTVLKLTWWPLLRDSIFYIITLALLIAFFVGNKIEYWESIIMFSMYIVYVIFMTFNAKIERFVKSRITSVPKSGHVTPFDEKNSKGGVKDKKKHKSLLVIPTVEFAKDQFRNGPLQLVIHTLDPIAEVNAEGKLKRYASRFSNESGFNDPITETESANSKNSTSPQKKLIEIQEMNPKHGQQGTGHHHHVAATRPGVSPTKETHELQKQAMKNQWSSHNSSASDVQKVRDVFQQQNGGSSVVLMGTDNTLNGARDILLKNMDGKELDPANALRTESRATEETTIVTPNLMTKNGVVINGQLANGEAGLPPVNSGSYFPFNNIADNNNPLPPDGVPNPIPGVQHRTKKATSEDSKVSTRASSRCSSRKSSRCASYHRGLTMQHSVEISAPKQQLQHQDAVEEPDAAVEQNEDEEEEEEEEEGPLDMSWPDSCLSRIYYIVKFPLCIAFLITIPDVRRPVMRKFFPIAFIMSICWIAGLTYMMVWWAETICKASEMPATVMGLTILAAGTSVPDLITSVVVARQGHGDMAVSSSIGSNIFDVTVGLPIPWLIKSLTTGNKPIDVNSEGLFCSTFMLFLMLISVIVTIAICKWRMTRVLGATMFGLYLVFITITLLIELDKIPCLLQG